MNHHLLYDIGSILKIILLYIIGLFLTIVIGLLSIDLMTYFKAKFRNRSNFKKNIKNLPNFKPLKPHTLLFIHALQPIFVLNELLIQAERTKLFTILPKLNNSNANQLFLLVEFIQDTQSILVLIEYNHDLDRNTQYYQQLNTFFSILFDSSKKIQTWGNCTEQLAIGAEFYFFTYGDLMKIQLIDIQKDFKKWYNTTFPHRIECSQYLKYNTDDNRLCSCSYRPYKSKSAQWSLSQALLYTFGENLNVSVFNIQKCLAITKLAQIVHENWTLKQLNNYKRKS